MTNISESTKHFVKAKNLCLMQKFLMDIKLSYVIECINAAYKQGARWVVLCDTNGGTLPHEISKIVTEVTKIIPEKIWYSCSQ